MAGWGRPGGNRSPGRSTATAEKQNVTTTGSSLQEQGRRSPPTGIPRVALLFTVIAGLLVAGGLEALNIGASHWYLLTPGNAPVVTASPECRAAGGGTFALPSGTPCVRLIVPAGQVHPLDGSIMMVDVEQGQPDIMQFAAYELGFYSTFYGTGEWIPASKFLNNLPASQLQCADTQQAMQATSAAPVAALRRLGYTVTETSIGAQIDTVIPGSPAAAAGLRCDDLVTAVDGTAVRSAADLSSALAQHKPGDTVHLTVLRAGAQEAPARLNLTAVLGSFPAIDNQPAQPGRPYLGVDPETRTTFNLPFSLAADVGAIGGPSDGLALALGFIDTLSGGQLTGGLKVAVTGAIDINGNVETIGGIAEKTVAVRRAGAQVFLVPPANYQGAKAHAGSLKVYPVSNLSEALAVLESLGGTLPPVAHGAVTTSAGPP